MVRWIDWLWTNRGSQPVLSAATDLEIIEKLGDFLNRQNCWISRQDSDWIEFYRPLLKLVVSPMPWMFPYEEGRFELPQGVEGRVLRYQCRAGYLFASLVVVSGISALVRLQAFQFGVHELVNALAWPWLAYGTWMVVAKFTLARRIRGLIGQ